MAELTGDVQKYHRIETPEAGEIDRISILPEPILLDILTLLPLKTAVRTCLLSKRWVSLWTALPSLSFWQDSPESDFYAFASFVDNTLRRCSAESIYRFRIFMFSQSGWDLKLPIWLRFASSRSVKELELNLLGDATELPVHLCAAASVNSMSLTAYKLLIDHGVRYPCLRYMDLGGIDLLEEYVIDKLLVGSPVLEELRIGHCAGLKQLNFSKSASLKKIVIQGIYDCKPWMNTGHNTEEDEGEDESVNHLFRIWGGPNVQYLMLTGKVQSDRKYCVENFPSLVEADLKFEMESYDADDRSLEIDGVIDIFNGVSHAEKLNLTTYCVQMLLLGEVEIFSSLPRLRSLVLGTNLSELDVIGLAGLLQSSCNLEELVIKLKPYPGLTLEERYYKRMCLNRKKMGNCFILPDRVGVIECFSQHLKKVQVVGFSKFHYETGWLYQFLEFLLSNAVVLEELSIITHKPSWRSKWGLSMLSNAVSTLLSFPKASEQTDIIFA